MSRKEKVEQLLKRLDRNGNGRIDLRDLPVDDLIKTAAGKLTVEKALGVGFAAGVALTALVVYLV